LYAPADEQQDRSSKDDEDSEDYACWSEANGSPDSYPVDSNTMPAAACWRGPALGPKDWNYLAAADAVPWLPLSLPSTAGCEQGGMPRQSNMLCHEVACAAPCADINELCVVKFVSPQQ
jgi:hypothetical protein